MYSKEQITFLMNNGFSLDEIMQMQAPAQPEPEPQPAQPDPEPQPVEKPVETVEKPAPQPEPRLDPGQNSQLEQLISQNQQLIQMIQRNNINGIQFGNPQPERTVDDILAEIINPPSKK